MENCLFDTHRNYIMTHGDHMFQTASDMGMEKMCAYPLSNYVLPHCKCVLHCCVKFPWIDLPSPESDQHYYNVFPTIIFHMHQHIARFTVHGKHPLNE